MSTPQERQQLEREQKLAAIQRQLEEGSLVIRKMTPEERRANPPKPRTARPRSRRR
jgi:hypothetical protein